MLGSSSDRLVQVCPPITSTFSSSRLLLPHPTSFSCLSLLFHLHLSVLLQLSDGESSTCPVEVNYSLEYFSFLTFQIISQCFSEEWASLQDAAASSSLPLSHHRSLPSLYRALTPLDCNLRFPSPLFLGGTAEKQL